MIVLTLTFVLTNSGNSKNGTDCLLMLKRLLCGFGKCKYEHAHKV